GSSVDELDVDLDAVARRGGAGHGADGRGHATALADDPAHVAVRDVEVELGATGGVDHLDSHAVGLLDERAGDVLEHRAGVLGSVAARRAGRLVGGLVAHFEALEAWNWSQAPDTWRSFCTRSEGCAPFSSHSTALSLSTVMADGSRRGS